MQYSIVKYSSVLHQEDLRFDADYYKPKYLRDDAQLDKFDSILIGDFAFVTDGQHGYHEVDDNSPIRHLTAKNAKNWFADSIGADRLAKWVDDKNRRSSLKENDLILSTRGTVGYCALVKKDVLPANIDQDVAKIALDSKVIIPEYALTFLNCEFGQDWLQRNTTGMVQQGLSLQKVRQTPIPILDVEFQESIRSVVVNAYNAIKDSENYFENAQAILLSELGLLAWQPKHRLSFVKNYSDTEQAGRIDAEHFQPKYDELIEIIKLTTQCKQIREIAKFNARGLQPQYNPEGQIKVVNSQHILDDHLDYDNFERTDDQSWDSQKKARIFQNDILIYTTGANIGRTNVYLIKDKCIASNHVNILRLEKENQIYVGFVMNSIIGRLQTQKHKSGAAQAELYPSDIEKFIVPFAKEETQNRITELLMSSFEKKIQSKAMLDIAKRAVEIAIEQNEDSALKWIGEQTKETGRH